MSSAGGIVPRDAAKLYDFVLPNTYANLYTCPSKERFRMLVQRSVLSGPSARPEQVLALTAAALERRHVAEKTRL